MSTTFRTLPTTFAAVFAILAGSLPGRAAQDGFTLHYRTGATNVVLASASARQQILATSDTGRDLTRSVTWFVEPPGLARIDATGRVSPATNGEGVILARSTNGTTASLPLVVRGAEQPAPIHFANQIVPVFTKTGCNGGGCHGKAAGQNGFRLSLLGFEPLEDYEHLVHEARGRRLFPAAPERSLLLTKGTAQLPHGGGRRLEPDSDDYQLLHRWIAQGMPLGRADAPTVERLEVFPSLRTLALDSDQQLVVTAHYSDGSTEDVTHGALFESNDRDVAAPDAFGRVKTFNLPGEVAVMVRYQGLVATFRGTVPLGAPVDYLPPVRTFVDDHVFRQLRAVGMPPSPLADDATFLRRVTLDIAGRLPTLDEQAAFLVAARQEDAPASEIASSATTNGPPVAATTARQRAREAVVDRLLGSPEYAEYFAAKWTALLRNRRNDARQQRGAYAFHAWVRDRLRANQPYDQFVQEILTASGDLAENPSVTWYRQVRTMQGQLEDVSQLFLGQRLQCAQCHHHPYERWSQADYWSFGAFFSQVSFKPGAQAGEEVVVQRRTQPQATNKKTGQPVRPAGLAASPPTLGPDDDARAALADWMTSPGNPWFARALVNRYWKHFFGRGLVDPEDDLRETNPATNPELLQALAADFVEHGFDLKHLVRTLTRSSTYQLGVEPNAYNGRDRHHFARFQPRRLPAEVLFDAINEVTQSTSQFEGLPPGTRAVCLPDNSFNAANYFLTVFGRPENSSSCECERSQDASLGQSLHLLNSKEVLARVGADAGRAARFAAGSVGEDSDRVRDLYRLALARDPQPDETRVALDHLARRARETKEGKDAKETEAARLRSRRDAWEDLVWALVNTKEFLFNH